MSGIFLGPSNSAVNKTMKVLALVKFTFSLGRQDLSNQYYIFAMLIKLLKDFLSKGLN